MMSPPPASSSMIFLSLQLYDTINWLENPDDHIYQIVKPNCSKDTKITYLRKLPTCAVIPVREIYLKQKLDEDWIFSCFSLQEEHRCFCSQHHAGTKDHIRRYTTPGRMPWCRFRDFFKTNRKVNTGQTGFLPASIPLVNSLLSLNDLQWNIKRFQFSFFVSRNYFGKYLTGDSRCKPWSYACLWCTLSLCNKCCLFDPSRCEQVSVPLFDCWSFYNAQWIH